MRKINWVIPGGRSKRMFLMLGCVSWILMLLCSCGRNLPDSEQVIKRYLKEKYNQEFQIVHTERKNIGQNFGEFINTGEAVSLNESDDAFSFTIYEDGRITDNYPKVILGNQIKQDIYSILDHGKLEYTNVDIRFIESDQEYVTFEDYKSNHNVLIFSDLKGLETNVDKNIENAYDLLCALRDQGYYFCLTIDIDKASKTSVYKGYKQDKIEMRGDRAEMSDFPLYLNTVAGGLDCRDQTIGGFSFVVKIYAVPVVEIIG